MRRYARSLILIAVLLCVAVAVLAVQKISLVGFERGGDTVLGLSLGLDLQGGIHLVYQVEDVVDPVTGLVTPPDSDDMEGLKRIIERRVNSSGLGEPIIQILGQDRLLVQLPGVSDSGRAKEIIGETAQLEFKHRRLDVPVKLEQFVPADVVSLTARRLPTEEELAAELATTTDEGLATTTDAAATSTVEAQAATAEATSTEEAQPAQEQPPVLVFEFTEAGADKFGAVLDKVAASFAEASPRLSRLEVAIEGDEPLRYTDAPSFYFQRLASSTRYAMALEPYADAEQDAETLIAYTNERLGASPRTSFTEIQGSADEDIGLTGDDLERSFAGTHSGSGIPIVNIEFNDRGTRIFGELTQQIVGTEESIAIFLDKEELISPVVTSVITSGTGYIQGNFTLQRAQDIALLLESGRLPVPVELVQERDIDAILGVDSLNKSVIAGLVGLGLVLVFMTLYYRVPGAVAAVALLIYAALLLAIFKVLPVTLTLSGVAAAILSVGMAVDANILIFERMKDELRAGRTLLSAINIGFDRAWPAIRDGNVSTLITCGILFWFSDQLGTTIVQGFAATLAIGVLVSMFSAITVSRTLLRVLATTPISRRLGVFVPTGGGELPQRQISPGAA